MGNEMMLEHRGTEQRALGQPGHSIGAGRKMQQHVGSVDALQTAADLLVTTK